MVGMLSPLSGSTDMDPTAMDIYFACTSLRGIQCGGTHDAERMVSAIEYHNMKPCVGKVFNFEEALLAYDCLQGQSFVGKVCIVKE